MEERTKDFIRIEATLVVIIILLACLSFCGCTKTEYVTVEKIRTDTTYITKHQRDSIWLHDSVYVKEWMKGDTVYRDRDRWHTVYRETKSRDTIYRATHDTIPQPYPVIKEVEKPLSRRQKAVFTIGVMTIIGVLCWIVWWAVKILRRFGILRI